MRYALGWFVLLILGAGPASALDCRVPHVPARNAVKPPVGCNLPSKPRSDAERLKKDGFVDLGNGTHVKIQGRVRVDAFGRR